jgi:hypothetical protein
VSVGQWVCMINGKCYFCGTPDNPDPQKDCHTEVSCDDLATRRTPHPGVSPPGQEVAPPDRPSQTDRPNRPRPAPAQPGPAAPR